MALALVVETELPKQDQPSQHEEHWTNEPIIFRGIDFGRADTSGGAPKAASKSPSRSSSSQMHAYNK